MGLKNKKERFDVFCTFHLMNNFYLMDRYNQNLKVNNLFYFFFLWKNNAPNIIFFIFLADLIGEMKQLLSQTFKMELNPSRIFVKYLSHVNKTNY